MNYKVQIKEIEKMRIVYMKYHGKIQDANKIFPIVFKSVKGISKGAPFFNYLDFNPKNQTGNLELCLPALENPSLDGVFVKEVPSTMVLSTIHKGPYKSILKAYEAINRYSIGNNIKLNSNFREIFIKGPGMFFKGNPNKYITEIQFPMMED